MRKLSLASFAAATLAGATLIGAPSALRAQIMAGPGLGKFPVAPEQKRQAPPAALPGAQNDRDRVVPAEKQAMDMPPTEALFDAINRGDTASARDAISRGADLNGHNMLGMSPLELSVDLGRNSITFLLLSLRGGDGGPNPAPKSAVAQKAGMPEGKPPPQRVARRSAAPAANQEAAAPTPRTAKQFAGDGGAPIPSAGFLGFDGRGTAVR